MALGAEAAQKRKRQIKAPWKQRLVDFFEFKANLISAARSGGGEGERKEGKTNSALMAQGMPMCIK